MASTAIRMRMRLFFVDWTDLSFFVVAAVRADAVRRLRLLALRAQARRRRGERIVRAPLCGAGLGVSAFWIRHDLFCLRSTVCGLRSVLAIVRLTGDRRPKTGDLLQSS